MDDKDERLPKSSHTQRKRTRKALRLANGLIFSYLFHWFLRRLFGPQRTQKRLLALHEKNALRVKRELLVINGLFIKVGQLISAMSHLLPEAYVSILESLQDDAPAGDFSDSKVQIESSLQRTMDELFVEFETTSIASASIGQVYRARLHSGELVAVKVQHPNIRKLAQEDLAIMERLIRRVNFFFRIQGIHHVYGQVREMIHDELDYRKEAQSMQKIRKNLASSEKIIVPQVFAEYSSDRVLTSSFEPGVKITNLQQMNDWGIHPKEIAEHLIVGYGKMILEDGFYHADPHPGNILINQDGRIVLLDFGATAQMGDTTRKELPILIQAMFRKDHVQIRSSLQKIGFIGTDAASEKMADRLIEALTIFLQNEVTINTFNLQNISFNDLKGSSLDKLRKQIRLRELTSTIQVPKDWVLLDRTLALLSGISGTIAPELNPIKVMKPIIQKQLLQEGGIQKMILESVRRQLTELLGLPSELSKFLKKSNAGQQHIPSHQRQLNVLGQQLIFALFMVSSVAFYLHTAHSIFLWSLLISALFFIKMFLKSRKL